jgi:hypothetical protein
MDTHRLEVLESKPLDTHRAVNLECDTNHRQATKLQVGQLTCTKSRPEGLRVRQATGEPSRSTATAQSAVEAPSSRSFGERDPRQPTELRENR